MSGSHVLVCRVCLCFAAVLDIWGPCFGLSCLVSGVFSSLAGRVVAVLDLARPSSFGRFQTTRYAVFECFFVASPSVLHWHVFPCPGAMFFGLPCLVFSVFCSRAGQVVFSFYTWHFTLHTLHFILHTPYLTLYARHSAFYTSLHSTLHTGAAALCVPMRHSFSYPGVAPHHPNPSLCWCFHVFGGPGGKKDAKIIRCFWRLIFGRFWAMFWRFFAAPWKQKHHKIPCVCPFCM